MTRRPLSTITARLAWCISVIFSPFLVPIATALGVVQKHAAPEDLLRWFGIVVLFVTLLPAASIAVMVPILQSQRLTSEKQKRTVPAFMLYACQYDCGNFSIASARCGTRNCLGGSRLYHKQRYFFCNHPNVEN